MVELPYLVNTARQNNSALEKLRQERGTRFGDRLDRLITAVGKDQTTVAKEIEVARATVGLWVGGEWPSAKYVQDLAIALRTNPIYLLTGEGPEGQIGEPVDLKTARETAFLEGYQRALAEIADIAVDKAKKARTKAGAAAKQRRSEAELRASPRRRPPRDEDDESGRKRA